MKIPNIQIHEKTYEMQVILFDRNDAKILILKKNDNLQDIVINDSIEKIKITQYTKNYKILSICEIEEDWYSLETRERKNGKPYSATQMMATSNNSWVSLSHKFVTKRRGNVLEIIEFVWCNNDFFMVTKIKCEGDKESSEILRIGYCGKNKQYARFEKQKYGKIVEDKEYKKKVFVKDYAKWNKNVSYTIAGYKIHWILPEREGEFCRCEVEKLPEEVNNK